MNFRNFDTLSTQLNSEFGESVILEIVKEAIQPYLLVASEKLPEICKFLYKTPGFYFDFLNCISACDIGPEVGIIEIWYHISSIPLEQSIILKVQVNRPSDQEKLPELPSISSIWQTADWHEREAYDLVGIKFVGHPDLRRILLPADWQGYPLRKDYQEAEKYHGIKIKY